MLQSFYLSSICKDMFSSLDIYSSSSYHLFKIFWLFLFLFIFIWLFFSLYSNCFSFSKWSFFHFNASTFFSGPLESNNSLSFLPLNLLSLSLFIFLCTLKIAGILPEIFSLTSQGCMILWMSLFLWLSLNLSNMSFDLNGFLSHLTPMGCPLYLCLLLVWMELISKIIRFLSLTLRLSINITTGHIFVTLLGSLFSFLTASILSFNSYGLFPIFLFIFGILTSYILFELVMSVIQGFVFGLLMGQYAKEHSMK